MLAPTAMKKVTLVALVGVPLLAISISWAITLVQFFNQGDQQQIIGLIGMVVFGLFIGFSMVSTFTRAIRAMKQRRNNAYHSFVSQTNQNFPQTQWQLQEFGSLTIRFHF
eukprot:s1551_g5.t1